MTLAIFKVALPLLVKVTLCGALVVPTGWLLNVTLAPLIVTPGAETGGAVTGPPPPPQEVNKRIEAMQTPAKIAGFAQRLRCSLVPIRQSEFDLERVHSLRGRVLFPRSRGILKQIDSPGARRVSRFMATHRFVEEYMVAACGRPFHLAHIVT
jgi:hypothetical protein